MTAWKPKTSPVSSCTEARGGGYLIVTASGDAAYSDHPLPQGLRLTIRGGKPVIPAMSNLRPASLPTQAAEATLDALKRREGQ